MLAEHTLGQRCPPGTRPWLLGHPLATLDLRSGQRRERPAFVRSAALTPKGMIIAVSGQSRSDVLRMPVRGCCGRLLFRTERFELDHPAVSPDGRDLAVTVETGLNGVSFIGVISLVNKTLRLLTSGPLIIRGPHHAQPAWSPDGKWVAFTARDITRRRGVLHIVSAAGGSRPYSIGVEGMSPTWGGDT